MKNKINNKSIKKFSKYFIVGIVGTFVHFSILVFLVEFLRCDPIISSIVGFIVTVLISYYLNYKWTFKSIKKHSNVLPRYVVVSIIGFCLNTFIMFLTVKIIGLWYLIGQLITVVIIPISNFTLNSYWSFK